MKNYGQLAVDSLESMCNEYVSTILHTSDSKCYMFDKESSGRADYEIKAENLVCVTEDKVQRRLLEGFAQTSSNSKACMKRTRENERGPSEISHLSEISIPSKIKI
ncbi:hypothetical protein RhiirC2_795789 [Rhizophagus irregularis]|uniref:Uncharacterized protein n=1 Tax=Rhizophagus irregularis TaxID=588596 RepID=A0A2N1MAX6_9GLOM|nr:hypothetical protein RhiirC2_795789 [Rhizophagus irregularis]